MTDVPLKPGDHHYRAYVGPPGQYDFMGMTQIALLHALGLRETHSVLDVGCGSLRAGRLLIPFLQADRYCGIEPNRWLVEEGLEQNVGRDMAALKRPRFDFNDRFDGAVFGDRFDFVVAQSILSHTKVDMARRCVERVSTVLAPDGLFVCTYVLPGPNTKIVDPPGDEWVYPGLTEISAETIGAIFAGAGLSSWRLPWFHPRQTWFAASLDPGRLDPADAAQLTGFVVNADALRKRR